jgi:hypothetical protein
VGSSLCLYINHVGGGGGAVNLGTWMYQRPPPPPDQLFRAGRWLPLGGLGGAGLGFPVTGSGGRGWYGVWIHQQMVRNRGHLTVSKAYEGKCINNHDTSGFNRESTIAAIFPNISRVHICNFSTGIVTRRFLLTGSSKLFFVLRLLWF